MACKIIDYEREREGRDSIVWEVLNPLFLNHLSRYFRTDGFLGINDF